MKRLHDVGKDSLVRKDNLNGEAYLGLVKILATHLKVEPDVLDPTLARFVGKYFNEDTIEAVSRVVAGTKHYLKRGQAVPDTSVPRGGEEWSLIQVWNMREKPQNKLSWIVTFEVLAGAMVDKKITVPMSARGTQWLGRFIGFPKWREVVYPRDLFGAGMKASINYKGGSYRFREYATGSGDFKHNRDLYRSRHGACIHGRTNIKCCPACDWSVETCELACRRLNATKN